MSPRGGVSGNVLRDRDDPSHAHLMSCNSTLRRLEWNCARALRGRLAARLSLARGGMLVDGLDEASNVGRLGVRRVEHDVLLLTDGLGHRLREA